MLRSNSIMNLTEKRSFWRKSKDPAPRRPLSQMSLNTSGTPMTARMAKRYLMVIEKPGESQVFDVARELPSANAASLQSVPLNLDHKHDPDNNIPKSVSSNRPRKMGPSPASEVTLATISLNASDLVSVDSVGLSAFGEPTETLDLDEYSCYFETTPLPRMTRTCNIQDLHLLAHPLLVPMSNRMSMELETCEMKKVESRMDQVSVGLVANTMVMKFFADEDMVINQRALRFWDSVDSKVWSEDYEEV